MPPIDVFVGIEEFFPFSVVIEPYIIMFIIIWGHIEDKEQITIAIFPFKSEDGLIGVVTAWVSIVLIYGL